MDYRQDLVLETLVNLLGHGVYVKLGLALLLTKCALISEFIFYFTPVRSLGESTVAHRPGSSLTSATQSIYIQCSFDCHFPND